MRRSIASPARATRSAMIWSFHPDFSFFSMKSCCFDARAARHVHGGRSAPAPMDERSRPAGWPSPLFLGKAT